MKIYPQNSTTCVRVQNRKSHYFLNLKKYIGYRLRQKWCCCKLEMSFAVETLVPSNKDQRTAPQMPNKGEVIERIAGISGTEKPPPRQPPSLSELVNYVIGS